MTYLSRGLQMSRWVVSTSWNSPTPGSAIVTTIIVIFGQSAMLERCKESTAVNLILISFTAALLQDEGAKEV